MEKVISAYLTKDGADGRPVFIWKIDDAMFSGWGDDHWAPEDLSPEMKLSAGGR